MQRTFRWQDGERLVLFGRGSLAEAGTLLPEGFALLSTARAIDSAPGLAARAGAVHHVPAGRVDEVAAQLRAAVESQLLVAFGGGRVIDVAKALGAADPPRRVAAIPTTLSGAEMTPIHRHAKGIAADTARVRPAIVINDPSLSASQPPAELAQSAANALGHAAEGPITPLGNPVARLAALRAVGLIASGLGGGAVEPDDAGRDDLALAALLAGYTIGSAGYGLHHVLSQTLARFAGVPHGTANAIMLPHALGALGRRTPEWMAELAAAAGADPVAFASQIRDRGGVARLRDAGVPESVLEHCAEQALERPELQMTPPAADLQELRALYAAAY